MLGCCQSYGRGGMEGAAETLKIENKNTEITKIENKAPGKSKSANKAPGKSKSENKATEKLKIKNEAQVKHKIENKNTDKHKIENKNTEIENKNADTHEIENKHKDSLKIENKNADSLKIENKNADTLKIENKNADTLKIENKNADTLKIENKNVDTLKIENKNADTHKVENKNTDTFENKNTDTIENKNIDTIENKNMDTLKIENKIENKSAETPKIENKPPENKLKTENKFTDTKIENKNAETLNIENKALETIENKTSENFKTKIPETPKIENEKSDIENTQIENEKEEPKFESEILKKEDTIDNKELEMISDKEMEKKNEGDDKVVEDEDKKNSNPDEDLEKNDSVKDDEGCSGSEKIDAPTSQDLSMKSEEITGNTDGDSDANSMDDNTFNIIQTENSESQEVSEITNESASSKVKENESGVEKENETEGETNEDSELSCLEEESEESESEESSGSGDESDDEREFDNDSLDGDLDSSSKKSESRSDVPKSLPLPLTETEPTISSTPTKPENSGGKAKTQTKIPSPCIRPRLRSFGKREPGDFTVEIYESKRRPQDIPSISGPNKKDDGEGSKKPREFKAERGTSRNTNKDLLATPSPCSELTTPDSGETTTLGNLSDRSQAKAEEDSDKLKIWRQNSDTEPKESIEKPTSESQNSNPSPAPSPQNPTENEGDGDTELKKPSPMAFTIELDGGGSGNGDLAGKKLDIAASLSKWAPKHRRNLSLTKVDEHKVVENFFDENGNSRSKRRSTISISRLDKVEERVGKPPVGRPRSGTIGGTGLAQGRRGGGYHSEGYFSSDQDDEGPRRTELKSPRSPRTPELKSPQAPQRLVRSSSQDSAKGTSLRFATIRMRTPSPDNVSRTSSHPMTLTESASFLIEKIMSGTPETQRKNQGGKNEGRSCCKGEKKPTVAEVTGRAKSEKGSKSVCKMPVECGNKSNSANSLTSGNTFNKRAVASDPGKEEKDDVSEAGTYTIEKDSSSPEVEQARNDIDRVFGVPGTESGGEGSNVITPRGNASPRTSPEDLKFKSPGSLSRNSPNWIQQWAAQVAEHTKNSESLKSPRGIPKLPPQSPHDSSGDSRPRRKLPTPPTASHHHSPSPFSAVSPKQSDLSDHETPTKGRTCDSSDTDALLRHTEQLVSSLQARVGKANHGGVRGSSFESHDSGGDSDIDTSTSYPTHDDDERLMKIGTLKAKLKLAGIDGDSDMDTSTSYPTQDEDDRLAKIGSQLKAKLKLSGIDGTCNSPPLTKSPRKPPDVLGLESRLKLGHLKRERSIVSDGGYDLYSMSREETSMQSDSSSDASEPAKDSRKPHDNNPPLKFNRAFSLRRARLGCDDSSSSQSNVKPPSPIDKKKTTARPSSAGHIPSSRKLPLSHSRSQSSVPRAPPPTKSAPSTGDFSRGDGGRFSLRLPRAGNANTNQSTVSKSPSRGPDKKNTPTRRPAPRSNSTLTSKEVDFQNWKRRKNYDPMKAAAEGRKRTTDKKGDKLNQSGAHSTSERSPSPPTSLLRSASFHGTEGMGVAGRWPRKNVNLYHAADEDGPYSLEEEQGQTVPHCSPLRRSPTSPHQLSSSPHTTSPARQPLLPSSRGRRSSYTLSDEGEAVLGSPTRKASLDESGSEGKRSPSGGSTRGGSMNTTTRSRAKMEALDNLVISTIHSLSVKVRTTSETLLQKLKSQYDEEGDRAALLEEVLAHLSESTDQSLTPGHTRSTSRELAGILRNLKKIEHALEVIDRVMVCEDDDDLDDDLEGGGGPDWGESDY